MARVELSHLYKFFDDNEVVRDVTIEIEDGQFVVLVGPSGCGKSTLLRMVAGLEKISEGTIRIGDVVVNDIPPKNRNIAMVFQNYALYPHMTVAENMSFSLRLRGESREEIESRVKRAAGILGLQALLNRLPRQLSGGQSQRVAMGRAIVGDPHVFLFDEPLSNLDAKLRVQMRTEIKALHQRLNTTTIYVTHDQVEAMTMADKIVVMHDGVVEQEGTPLDLYDAPANRFVAAFIGSPAMNLVSGTVVGGASHFTNGSGVVLPIGDGYDGPRDRRLVYGIRPEHIGLVPTGGVPVQVVVVEPTGAETQVLVRIGDVDLVMMVRDRVPLRPGETVGIAPDLGRVHLFDEESGRRVS